MYSFFLKHANMKGTAKEQHVHPVEEVRLYANDRGETYRAGSRRVFEFTAECTKALAKTRRKPSPDQVKAAAKRLLGVPDVKESPFYRTLRESGGRDKALNMRGQFAVETEPGIQIIVTSYGPPHPAMHPPRGALTLYVGHISGQDDVRNIKEIRALTQGRRPFLVVDPRGIGQSMAKTCGSTNFFDAYGSDYLYAATGEMLGESYLGRRVFDVLCTIDFLLDNGATEIRLMGRGLGSVTAAFAALLHPSEPRVRLMHYLPSYELIAKSPRFTWPLSSLLRGCLMHFDLPDVYRVLGRRLVKTQPWDAKMKPPRKR